MQNNSLKSMTITAILTALNIVISRCLLIPIPFTHGNINLCDAGIFIVAILYGTWSGFFTGAVSGFLLDMISGYSQYMFFSLVIHGLEGLVVGFFFHKYSYKISSFRKIFILFIGVVIMVLGYFIADTIIYNNIKIGYLGIPMNFIQGIVGIIVSMLIVPYLRKVIKE